MNEEEIKKELSETEENKVSGGTDGVYMGHPIITGLGRACGLYKPGANFYNRKVMAISGTCGACEHMQRCDGWHVCGAINK